MALSWPGEEDITVTDDDISFMLEHGCFLLKYFRTDGQVYWGFFSTAGQHLSVKGIDVA